MSDEKEELARRFDKSGDADTAAFIRDTDTKIERTATPFFRDGAIYAASKFAPTRPVIRYLGTAGTEVAALLNSDPDAFFRLASAAGLSSSSGPDRVAYVECYLKIVHAGSKRLIVLRSVDEIRPRPNLDKDKAAQFDRFVERFRDIIKPPATNVGGVELFAIHKQDLVKISAGVSGDGRIDIDESVLERDILIPYAL